MGRLRNVAPRVRLVSTSIAAVPEKQADPHYLTPEHRRWRELVIKLSGGRCRECKTSGRRLFADHIVELRDGGDPVDPFNGQALCGRCHSLKTSAARARRMAQPT
jgi:5-methylcytosine-specific restriction endonuclease McrA